MKSGRRIEELVAAPAPPAPAKRLRPGAVAGAVRGPAPEGLAPQLAASVGEPPAGADWLHEIKLDGYRTLAHRAGDAVRLMTRSGLDWTHRYGDLADAFRALPCREAVIDGEIVVLDDKGVSRFALLQDALSRGAKTELVFFAFDLLHLDGWTLTGAPLAKRKALLAQLLAGATGRSAIQYSDHVQGGGRAFYDQVSALGLEGVVSKRANAPYQPGRSKTWVKAKAKLVGDFVIAGFTLSDKAEGIGALALATWEGDTLRYRGKVGTGFDAATLADLHARLAPLEDKGTGARRGAAGRALGAAGVLGAGAVFQHHQRRIGAPRRLPRAPRRRRDGAGRAGAAGAAGVGGRPRDGLGDEPDPAAVRALRADQARRRGLLRGDRGLHAAASVRAAGEPRALPDGQAGGLLLPAPPLPRDAGGGRRLRDAGPATRRTAPT